MSASFLRRYHKNNMTHVVHPYAHRLGIIRDWKSRWFAGKKQYRNHLRGDVLVREFLEKRLRTSYVSSIEIERSRKVSKIIIRTSRPGMIIGRQGEGATRLKNSILDFMRKNDIQVPDDLKIDIVSVDSPESDAAIIGWMIVEALEKRMPFRRIMKQMAEKVMNVRGVKGVRIVMAGRLGGAEMARREEIKKGSMRLQTIRADVDYAQTTARLPYGGIGIKVWVYKGDTLEEDQTRD